MNDSNKRMLSKHSISRDMCRKWKTVINAKSSCYSNGGGRPCRCRRTGRCIVFAMWRQRDSSNKQLLGPTRVSSELHLDRLNRFCRVHRHAQHTHTHTHPIHNQTTPLDHICTMHAMRPKSEVGFRLLRAVLLQSKRGITALPT